MTSLSELLSQGGAHPWLFIPSAILLGALHGLEPGHSKTMMASFIVAIRGTVTQAVLLGLAATISHTAVVWAIALGGMYLWKGLNAETLEPYLQIVSAIIIIAIAVWMLWRTWRDQQASTAHAHHHHGDEARQIDTGHGLLNIEVCEDGVPPRWRVTFLRGESFVAKDVTLETCRPDGTRQMFAFEPKGTFLQSIDEIPEPHEFKASLRLAHGNHGHTYDLEFHEHDHGHTGDVNNAEYQDAHERAHASDIQKRFTNRQVTTGQVVLFGLTGGLIPCPAAVTVLLLCLQLKEIPLGAVLVLCFSIGLAITLVSVGTVAALVTSPAYP